MGQYQKTYLLVKHLNQMKQLLKKRRVAKKPFIKSFFKLLKIVTATLYGCLKRFPMNLLTTEEDSVLASTQDFTADLFSSDVSSQEDIHMDTSSLEMEKIHDSA